eukprot:7072162-Alexandrium_andersonii.AAC.1
MACRSPTDMSGHGPAASSHAEPELGVPAGSPRPWGAARRSISEVGPCAGGGTVVLGTTAAMQTNPCPQSCAAPCCAPPGPRWRSRVQEDVCPHC